MGENKIVGIVQRTDITPEGKFVKVMRVSYVTKSGVTGSLEIPKKVFTAAKAKELMEKEAAEIEGALKG